MARELFVMGLLVDSIVTIAARTMTAAIRTISVFFVSYLQMKYFGSNKYPLRSFRSALPKYTQSSVIHQ
jgi:hypothetical protein